MKFRIIAILIIAFLGCSEADDTPDPIIINPETNNTLLQEVATDLNGYKIAFGDTEKIYMMNPNGSNIEELANAGPISGYVSWSPDAKYVYYASAKGATGTAWEAWRVNVQTKEETKISNFDLDVRSLGVSPDGLTLALSVMTGNSNIGNNNDNLTQFSTNLYTVPMSLVENKIAGGNKIVMSDLTAIQSSPNNDQFWYEEINWNHDISNPTLVYTKTWRYDEDDVSYTHAYTIKPDGSANTLIAQNKDQPIWSIDNTKLSFLDLSYYHFSNNNIQQIVVTGITNEVSGGAISPVNGSYIVFEVGDENRKGGIAKTTENSNIGIQLPTNNIDVYELRWSPVPVN
ncbi:hypothetical protein [uncultured Lacinutrix sp.]|uniref:TolB family protein n=1 Tax=uncultured Lacinutrix sp. TaxID=574032 RepID=UPI002634A4F0|nr:hypothetical protein [uncultured Lacinutrix sp.]